MSAEDKIEHIIRNTACAVRIGAHVSYFMLWDV